MTDLGWYGRTSYDRRQNDRIAEMEIALSYQRSEARRLNVQLAKAQGTMENRLTRLATAFDAFVELSDLREELRVFQPAAEARHHTQRLLARLLAPRKADPSGTASADLDYDLDNTDVPGYWLPAAAAALAATLRGDTAASDAAMATARDRDPDRSDLFVCAGLLLARRPELALDRLDALLDLHAGTPVTRAQRVLWQVAADGELGEAGQSLIGERLQSVVAGMSPAARATEMAAWRSVVDTLAEPETKSRRTGSVGLVSLPPAWVAPVRAVAGLDALQAWCAERLAAPAASAPPATSDTAPPPPDPVFAMVQELGGEGMPEEQPLLNRVAELRRIVQADGGEPGTAPIRWHNPLDEPLALLRSDASGGATPGLRAVAVHAVAPLLAAVADQLVTEAGRPIPDEVDMPVRRYTIRYGAGGPLDASVAEAHAGVPVLPPDHRPTQIGWGLVGSGAGVVLFGGIVTAVPLIIVGLALAGGGVWQVFRARLEASQTEQYRQRDRARLDEEIDKIGQVLTDVRLRAAKATDDAAMARAALDTLFAADAAAVPATTAAEDAAAT
jgi:hypothetical protein